MSFDFFDLHTIRMLLAAAFMLSGALFFLGSCIGMLRLPDFYTRMHASGNSETLGCTLSFIGLIIYQGFDWVAAKLLCVSLLVFLCNPIGSHILGKAAFKGGHPVWTMKDYKPEVLSKEEEH